MLKISIYLLLHLLPFLAAQNELPFVRESDCQSNAYFDISHLKCKPCPTGAEKSPNGLSCVCKNKRNEHYKKVSDIGLPASLKCQRCPAGQVASPDGWLCAPCAKTNTSDASCQCSKNQILYARSLFGIAEQQQQCSECRANTKPSADRSHCKACNTVTDGPNCRCTELGSVVSGGVCFAAKDTVQKDNINAYTVTLENGDRIQSSYFREHLFAAEASCRLYRNLTACQVLANLCVLLHYELDRGLRQGGDACTMYYDLTAEGTNQPIEWPENMAWLYYDKDARIVLDQLDIPTVFTQTGDVRTSRLKFYVAEYTLGGQYVGLKHVDGGMLQLCKAEHRILDGAFDFGRRFHQRCQVSIRELLQRDTQKFYDMYFEHQDGKGNRFLHPVPVLNTHLKERDILVNQELSRQQWKLTRRFFLVDGTTGLDNTPRPVRYAKKITISITLQPEKHGRIYPPFMTMEYGAVLAEKEGIEGVADPLEREVTVEFEVTYAMDTQKREKALEIVMGILSSLGALWAVIRTWSWTRRSGRTAIDFLAVLKFVVYLCSTLANVFLFTMLILSLWLLIFAKKQQITFLLFPTEDQQYSFLIYTGLAMAFKFIELVHLIIEQVTVRVFFLDWERPRGHVIPPNGETGGQDQSKTPSPVTIWRSYLVANEWNELQVRRKTSHVLQLFLMVLLLKILNLESLALIGPGNDVSERPKEFVDTEMSRFAVFAGLYLLVGFFQWAISVFIVEQLVFDQFHNYADLCSISNISVFVLQYSQYGYYIHGRSVHGHADTNMREMNEMLQRERENLCSQRGLEPNTEQQSFIMCLPNMFTSHYQQIISPVLAPNMPRERMSSADPVTVKMDNVIEVYEEANQYLCAFVDHIIPEVDYVVLDRQFMEAVVDIEFQNTAEKGIFYNDKSDQAFTNVLFYGHEFTLLTFDLLLFCIVDFIAHDVLIAAVISFLMVTIIKMFRQAGGTKNLVRTSMVDERFLI